VGGGQLFDPPLWASPCAGPASNCVPKLLTRPAGQAPRRRGLAGPCVFKGTLLDLRKRNFAVSAALRLSSDHPVYQNPCVLHTGAGTSVVREDVLPPGWKQQARRAPRSTHVCDASGKLLKVKSQVGLSVFVDCASMPFQFLQVKALSVPVIQGMDVQQEHVKAIYPGCETVAWNHGGLTMAENAWDGRGLHFSFACSFWASLLWAPGVVAFLSGLQRENRYTLGARLADELRSQCLKARNCHASQRTYLPGGPRGVFGSLGLTAVHSTALTLPELPQPPRKVAAIGPDRLDTAAARLVAPVRWEGRHRALAVEPAR